MAFEDLKAAQSAMWGAGPYEQVSVGAAPAHEHLIRALPPYRGERWLDVATGTGEIACRAAALGAQVTGLDLAPALIERARRRADAAGLEVLFEVGDAEQLPYGDASFDTVSSSFGVIFAPDQQAAASELARVTKPGGRVGLLTWHPTRGVPELFAVMVPYMPPRPEGVGNPFEWGDRDNLERLLGEAFELSYEEADVPHRAASGEEVWELFSTAFGPTRTLVESLDEERLAALKRDWIEYCERQPGDGGVVLPRPYLQVTGRRR